MRRTPIAWTWATLAALVGCTSEPTAAPADDTDGAPGDISAPDDARAEGDATDARAEGDATDARAEGDATDAPPVAPHPPPPNPALANSAWASSHRSSYAQGSSPLPGPHAAGLAGQHVYLSGSPITLAFSGPYGGGPGVIWASPLNSVASVVKLAVADLALIDEYVPAEREEDPPAVSLGISGAYNLVDADRRFVVARARSVEVFEDATPGDPSAPIALATRFRVPDEVFCGADDVIVGMTMTYDGAIAFVTQNSVVGLLPRDPAQMNAETVVRYALNGAACDEDGATLETVSNSIAADETGGVYVVTSGAMYRLDWDGAKVALGWRAAYATGDGAAGVRLGGGSGSTPSLMGTPDDADRFVVITDGQPLMHLVLFWRDAIPEGWAPVRPDADPRIACEVPITFGQPDAKTSLSEQSVLVSGYSSVVVSNLLADPEQFADQPALLQNILSALEGGNPAQAPHGIERIDWDPATRSCAVVWANPAPSIPNAIPTLSTESGLIYAQGQVDGDWGLYALSLETGAEVFFEPAPSATCEGALDGVAPVERLVVQSAFERLPRSCENSFYAATEVGPDGAIFQGTWYGATRYGPP